ncbi:MAG TPA: metal-dependent transcriptional regulator [Chitinophagales bacterium]|nr:metal-dependent transcriptional regulator [Chitinophagales bacterium]
MLSTTEENYLKAIFKLSGEGGRNVSTNSIAREISTSAASVTDMLRKLAQKKLIHYEKYRGVQLTKEGRKAAVRLIRSHRLWEVFLLEKLGFRWDQVHEVAEEMEHVRSPLLIARLEKFLGYPKFDPHGDPIPDEHGKISYHRQVSLIELKPGEKGRITGVVEQNTNFLQYLDKMNLALNSTVEVIELNDFDNSRHLRVKGKEVFASEKVCKNLIVEKI